MSTDKPHLAPDITPPTEIRRATMVRLDTSWAATSQPMTAAMKEIH